MRMPLLLEANPREISTGPRVRLPEGEWKFSIPVYCNSVITIHGSSQDGDIVADLGSARVRGPAEVNTVIIQPGTEARLSVYAELVK